MSSPKMLKIERLALKNTKSTLTLHAVYLLYYAVTRDEMRWSVCPVFVGSHHHHQKRISKWLTIFLAGQWRNISIHFLSCWSDFQKVLKQRKVMPGPRSGDLWLGRYKQILPSQPQWSQKFEDKTDRHHLQQALILRRSFTQTTWRISW